MAIENSLIEEACADNCDCDNCLTDILRQKHMAECDDFTCGYCTGYAVGYDHGKSKAYFEVVQTAAEGLHDHDHCGCRPCIVIRSVRNTNKEKS